MLDLIQDTFPLGEKIRFLVAAFLRLVYGSANCGILSKIRTVSWHRLREKSFHCTAGSTSSQGNILKWCFSFNIKIKC